MDLPEPFHKGSHPGYSSRVNEELQALAQKNEGPLSMDDARALQDRLRSELNGHLDTHGNTGNLNNLYK